MPDSSPHTAVVGAQGHLIDSNILTTIFDVVIARGGTFEVVDFQIGRTNDEFSRLTLKVSAATPATLQHLVEDLIPLGCHLVGEEDALVRSAERDRSVPDDFYSTTNLRTHVRVDGRWIEVERQRMDAVIVVDDGRAVCRKLRDIRTGDRVVCGLQGLRVSPEFRERDRAAFGFMSNDISSERRVEATVVRIAALLHDTRRLERRIVFVAGPVVVHTGGAAYLSELIRAGWVDVVLAGNALAVHDVELELFGTSLGVDLESGVPVQGGHRHHMRAINAINRAGGIRGAVQSGVISRGVMAECVRHGVDYVLAGSIRDDGPIVDTLTDMIAAQDRYAEALASAGVVIMLGTMLHAIGVGNMLPAWVPVVCVDINPAVVTKLADRGSSQTIGVVTDVGLFLHQLARQLVK
jgi:lysine-ketoglutarate reductase/saccharopine dehydrogenase-like protein (TIGR00300 family)